MANQDRRPTPVERQREEREEAESVAQRAFQRAIRKEVRHVVSIQNPWVAAVAVVILGALGVIAAQEHINSGFLFAVVAAISGVAGYAVHGARKASQQED